MNYSCAVITDDLCGNTCAFNGVRLKQIRILLYKNNANNANYILTN